jgi:hypothetical protein
LLWFVGYDEDSNNLNILEKVQIPSKNTHEKEGQWSAVHSMVSSQKSLMGKVQSQISEADTG